MCKRLFYSLLIIILLVCISPAFSSGVQLSIAPAYQLEFYYAHSKPASNPRSFLALGPGFHVQVAVDLSDNWAMYGRFGMYFPGRYNDNNKGWKDLKSSGLKSMTGMWLNIGAFHDFEFGKNNAFRLGFGLSLTDFVIKGEQPYTSRQDNATLGVTLNLAYVRWFNDNLGFSFSIDPQVALVTLQKVKMSGNNISSDTHGFLLGLGPQASVSLALIYRL